eukprot:TRINITY_DN3970_c0_g1_i4.p1 TRINITY_DN3970_c0_g1~~TRINITY_DN3970_c0_g1_i4.p1  ORF type:complete len:300 (-),score=66.11 TRINITY_DN3970_c0_g1_i4:199-1098(-)
MRPLWRHYFQHVSGFIFVVDSNDRIRMPDARDDLRRVLEDDELRGVPFLFLANKQDLPQSLSVAEITDALGLHGIHDRAWHIQGTCTLSGDGLDEGLKWLDQIIKNPRPQTLHDHAMHPAPTDEKASLFTSWLRDDGLNDDEFIAKFKRGGYSIIPSHRDGAGSIGGSIGGSEAFTHRTFLRIIWTYLKLYGRRETMKRAFADLSPYVIPFNETLLYFWTHLIHYSMESISNPDGQFLTFLLLNPIMMDAEVMQDTYYTRGLLHSPEACKAVILPDKKPMPSMIPRAYSPVATVSASSS